MPVAVDHHEEASKRYLAFCHGTEEGPKVSEEKTTESGGRPSAARRTLLAGGVAGLAAVAGTALSRGSSAEAQTTATPSITDWINVVTDVTPPADPTGQKDSTAAIQAAINLAAAQQLPNGTLTGGVVYLPTGQYLVSSILTAKAVAPIYIVGDGTQATQINYTGSSACIRMYNSYKPSGGNDSIEVWGGGVRDLTIDGTNAGAGASGLHCGDLKYASFQRLVIQHFNLPGSIGLWIDNTIYWTENSWFEAHLLDNTTGCQIDVSVSTANSAHDNCLYDFSFAGNALQNGVVITNGANPYHSRFWIHGGIATSTSAPAPQNAALIVTGSGGANGTESLLNRCELVITMESDGGNTYTPQTIQTGSANTISDCYGRLAFMDGYVSAEPKTSGALGLNGEFSFDGPVFGDAYLSGLTPSSTVKSGTQYTNNNPPAMLVVTGGSVSAIEINNTPLPAGVTSGAFYIPMKGTYQITYSAAPTITWVPMCPQ
jgi:hypothetical protein